MKQQLILFALGISLGFAPTVHAEPLTAGAPYYMDNVKSVDPNTGQTVVKSQQEQFLEAKFVSAKTIELVTDTKGHGKALVLDFKSNADAVFFKEKILKNPDLELHTDNKTAQRYTGGIFASSAFYDGGAVRLRDVWVKDPKTGLQQNLAQIEGDKGGWQVAVIKAQKALAPNPSPPVAAVGH